MKEYPSFKLTNVNKVLLSWLACAILLLHYLVDKHEKKKNSIKSLHKIESNMKNQNENFKMLRVKIKTIINVKC